MFGGVVHGATPTIDAGVRSGSFDPDTGTKARIGEIETEPTKEPRSRVSGGERTLTTGGGTGIDVNHRLNINASSENRIARSVRFDLLSGRKAPGSDEKRPPAVTVRRSAGLNRPNCMQRHGGRTN
ncbi:hypothetical protein BRD01_03105 [Halobacteriales archaeon QS_8_65_32]|nr:MAG: hypothetical protein BRD01_03105 [Halobacteriales archaeon QS_8_65_32]